MLTYRKKNFKTLPNPDGEITYCFVSKAIRIVMAGKNEKQIALDNFTVLQTNHLYFAVRLQTKILISTIYK
jgi:hypothetical protein